jgi:hypothetical protein
MPSKEEQKLLDQMTEYELQQYLQNVEMGDTEFEVEEGAFLGDRDRAAVEADRVRAVGGPNAYNWEGIYVSDDPGLQATVGEAFQNRGFLDSTGDIEEDTVYLIGQPGMTGGTPSHELMHRSNELRGQEHNRLAHDMIYVRMGYRSRTKEEWDYAVRAMKNYTGESYSDAEKQLSKLVERFTPLLIDEEARAGMEGRYAVANPPENEYDQVGLLGAYTRQAQELADYRARRRTRK